MINIMEFRRFYRHNLSQFLFFRVLKEVTLTGYQFFDKYSLVFIRPFRACNYTLIKMSDFQKIVETESITLEDSGFINIPGPKFIGQYPVRLNTETISQLDMPDLKVIKISHSKVVGGTNFILVNQYAIHPDLFIPSRDVCPAETFDIAVIKSDYCKVSLNISQRSRHIHHAISLLGQCTRNYAHWLTETLPKLMIIDSCLEYKDYPLLVDSWIHPVFFETIKLLSSSHRKIIPVERWESISLTEVIDVSPPAYIPPEFREYTENKKLPVNDLNVFPFSKTALEMLRKKAQKSIAPYCVGSARRLYLRRSKETIGNMRNVVNVDEVENLLSHYGFEIIEPGALPFSEQISLFQNAQIIVSPVGAALANTIFTNPGCTVIALAAYYENANYYFFSNLMGALEHELYYVLGPQVDCQSHPSHKEYYVDMNALKEALDKLC